MRLKYIIDSSDLIEVAFYVKWTDFGPYILSDDEVKDLSEPLDSNIRKEITKWKVEDWATRAYIDAQSAKQQPDGSFTIDFNKHTDCFIQCLLREWTLGDIDPQLKITIIDRGDVQVINPETMKHVRRLPANIMTSLINKAMNKIRGVPDLKNLKSVP